MRLHINGGLSDEEDVVHSGSATEREEMMTAANRVNMVLDPVTQILDKIDAELVSLTRSQASNSTSTTATDSTVIRRPGSGMSFENSRMENGDGLSMSQLAPSYKPSVSPHSSQMSQPGRSSDHDTGIGTSSIQDSSVHYRSLEPEIRPLEPGDQFKDARHRYSDNQPEMMLRHSHHMSDDDKQRRENQNQSPFEAKNVDEKFKEIMQKRKAAVSRPVEDDTQTIRTEDFVDKFQDTLVYTSDAGDSPVPRRIFERPKKKLPASLEARTRKAGGPGYPPIYPKPTQTTSLPRPAMRSSLKVTPGHTSDADSVKTEDFEYKFKDMMVGRKEESDLESVSNDPIHTKVKQLLKATDRYKQPSEVKTKQHVRISAPVASYQTEDKGNDSDDTLCSEKHSGVTSLRPKEPRSLPETDNGLEETHREIARESDKIRREMERERRAKSSSPVRDRSPTRTYLTLTQSPKTLYDKGDRPNVNGASKTTSLSDEEKEKTAELKATQNALEVTQSALYEARKNLKEVQAQHEDIRTQLMLTEYKRQNSAKELAQLSEDLQKKQREATTLESEAKSRREELKQFDAIGFTKDEAVHIIEENEKMKNKLRNLDAIHAERDELIQQLETTKQDLFNEQKRARTQIEELKEEMENLTSTCEQTQSEKEDVAKKLQKIEAAYKKMEKEKNELIQEKTRQYEEERDKHKSEKAEWRKRNLDDVEALRQDLTRMTNRVASLQDELRAKEELHLQLRDQILTLQEKNEQEKASRSAVLEEHKKTLQSLRKDTDTAMVQLRESLFLEKQKTVEAMREELEHERREIASRSDERYKAQIFELETIIKAKNEETAKLNKLADKLQTDLTRSKVKMEDEIKQEVQEAVSAERKALEEEKDWAVQQEKDRMAREHRQAVAHLQEELSRMQQEQRNVEARLKEQRHELEELKNSNKAIQHEKLVAVARAKELMRQEHLAELDRIKEQMKNEHKKEIEKLRETIRLQEEELRQLREDRLHYLKQQKENSMALDRTERTLVNEINEECRKTSEVLGISPRKVTISSSSTPGSQKNTTTSALANLRACNEELRMHVTDLQRELEVLRNSLNVADRHKDEALSTLKRQLEREKEEEMARLKERLVRGLSTNEYRSLLYTPEKEFSSSDHRFEMKTYPSERSLRQMSEQQQQDLDRLEREINRLANASDQMSPATDDVDYAKRLAQLQAKVKQLQTDNSKLRRVKLNVSSSVPDLTTPEPYSNHRRLTVRSPSPTLRSPSPTRDQQRLASTLELRLREQDYETETLTQHQRLNREIMSKKMAEMSKLQNMLTNQAKELIQLEKAYTQLNQYAKSPRVSVR